MKPADATLENGGLLWRLNPETDLIGLADKWCLSITVQDCLGDSMGMPVQLELTDDQAESLLQHLTKTYAAARRGSYYDRRDDGVPRGCYILEIADAALKDGAGAHAAEHRMLHVRSKIIRGPDDGQEFTNKEISSVYPLWKTDTHHRLFQACGVELASLLLAVNETPPFVVPLIGKRYWARIVRRGMYLQVTDERPVPADAPR